MLSRAMAVSAIDCRAFVWPFGFSPGLVRRGSFAILRLGAMSSILADACGLGLRTCRLLLAPIRPEQDMANFFSGELERGRLSRPPYTPNVAADSLSRFPWIPSGEPRAKAPAAYITPVRYDWNTGLHPCPYGAKDPFGLEGALRTDDAPIPRLAHRLFGHWGFDRPTNRPLLGQCIGGPPHHHPPTHIVLEQRRPAQENFNRDTGGKGLSIGQFVLYMMRFIFSGSSAGAWADFGGITAQLNNLAHVIEMAIADHLGIAITYDYRAHQLARPASLPTDGRRIRTTSICCQTCNRACATRFCGTSRQRPRPRARRRAN